MTESTRPPQYRSYLLRFWEERAPLRGSPDSAVWRFSLEDPHTAERIGFKSLDELVAFLRAQTQRTAPEDSLPPARP
jgi:hypothetical protein